VESNAHLLRFDSVHGRFPGEVTVDGDSIDIGRGKIKVTAVRDPNTLPWKDLGIDIALECTGIFSAKAKASMHLTAGAKRVLVSAPSDGADATIVYGVNHKTLTKDHLVVSNGSCTTNCLAPVAKVLNEIVGIETGFMTTIHAYTGDQPTLDTLHSDLYRGRAAAMSMIPTSTGAAKAIGLVMPELAGKLDGVSIRAFWAPPSIPTCRSTSTTTRIPRPSPSTRPRFRTARWCACSPGTTTNGVFRTVWPTRPWRSAS
jgi:glyceraldehyde 3-phosphate dehydrogenase